MDIVAATTDKSRPAAHPGLIAAALFYVLLTAALIGRLAAPVPSAGLWLMVAVLFSWRIATAFLPDRLQRPPLLCKRWDDAPAWIAFAILLLVKISGIGAGGLSPEPVVPDVLKLGARFYTVHTRFSVLLWIFPALLTLGGLGASQIPPPGASSRFRPVSKKALTAFFAFAWLTLFLIYPDILSLAARAGVAFSSAWILPAFFVPGLFVIYLITVYSVAGLTLWRGRLALGLRWLLFAALCAALAEPHHRDTRNELNVVYLLDVSRSIPADVQTRALTFINDTSLRRAPDDAAALVLFGGQAQTEQPLDAGFVQGARLATDIARCAPQETRIDLALDAARVLFPEGGRKRMVLLTDGNSTSGDDPVERVSRLARSGIAVDIVPLEAAIAREVIVDKMTLSADVLHAGEVFDIDVFIERFSACVVDVNLFCIG